MKTVSKIQNTQYYIENTYTKKPCCFSEINLTGHLVYYLAIL